MRIQLLSIILQLLQWNPFEPAEPQLPIEETFLGPSLTLYVFAWIFFSLGLLSLIILILYTKYGRDVSIKLSVINILFSSIFLGFAFHFFLIHFGL